MWSKSYVCLIIALALTRPQHSFGKSVEGIPDNIINPEDEDGNTEESVDSKETEALPEGNETKEIREDTEKDPDASGDTDTDPDGNIDTDPDGNIDTDPGGNTDTDPDGNTDTDPDDNTDTDPDGNTDTDPDEITDPDQGESGQEETSEIVKTDRGPVTAVYLHGTLGIKSYLDIPYGKFEKLFDAPTHPPPWEAHSVTEHSKRCPQLQDLDTVVGDNDCLSLSVFTPSDVINAPVLFHIYDGDFTTGSADPTIYGPEHFVPKGVILVLPNYRLGPLGFLCAPGSAIIPGNAALKDLTLALDWTRRNIEAFGGDPSNIVVSGEGDAGALVGYLTISPMSRNYIAGAIVESGSVLSHLAIDRNPNATAASLASRLVNLETPRTELDIFENTDVVTLLRAANHTKFKPCVDTGIGAFLNATPWSILREINTNISFMIGTADHAGMHESLEHTESSITELNNQFSELLPSDLQFQSSDDINYISDRLKRLYFGELDITIRDREKLAVWHTDTSYLGPSVRVARQLVEAGASVYFFEFSFIGALNRERNAMVQPLQGAARGDIIGYVFCQDGEMPQPNSAEERMIDTMTDLWATFMRTGKPSENWNALQKLAACEEEWASIGQQVTQEHGIHVQRLNTWTEVYDTHFVEHNLAMRVQGTLVTVIVIATTNLLRLLQE